jgi:hypothetical protein
MNVTVREALDLLRRLAEDVERTRAVAAEAESRRDALIRVLDGQPGMVRREMAAALGLTKIRVAQIAGKAKPERELLVDGVPMDEALYAQLVAAVPFARTLRGADAVRLDVDVDA